MEKLVKTLKSRVKSPSKLERSSPLFKTIIDAINEKKGEQVVSLDLRNIDEAVADFFILCEAESHIQIKAISDFIEEQVIKVCKEKPYHLESGEIWTLIDYVNVVVHIFKKEERKFYDLEGLWLDAERMEHGEAI